jgi:hypothetical protein
MNVTHKRCVSLSVADEGRYMAIWRKTVLIPWSEFKAVGQATLHWQEVPMLRIGEPSVATTRVPLAVFRVMRGKLPGGLA